MIHDIFSDIIGHETVKAGLLHAANTDHLHHALLFTGTAGIGKGMVATAFIQSQLCIHSTPEHIERCGECAACRRVALKTHPDVIEIDETTATIKIEVIREMQKKLVFPPFEAQRRFVIIQDVHKMQDAAANCLLKTLEEPEAHTTFILITSQIQKLLPTIISRCQVVRFAPFSFEQITDFLIKKGNSPDTANQIAALSGGSFGTALDLCSGDYKNEVLSAFENMISPNSTLDAFSVASNLKGKKNMSEHLLTLLSMFIRDMLVIKTSQKGNIILKHYQPAMMQHLSKTSEKDLVRGLNVIQEVNEAFQGNVNELVAWERLIIGMHGILF